MTSSLPLLLLSSACGGAIADRFGERRLGKGGSWAWRRLFSLGFSSYIIGFLMGEAFTLWYR